MSRSDLKNRMNQHEAVGMEHSDVADVLGSLPRVEAPPNFDFGLKAKLAGANAGTWTFLSFIMVAAPVSLILLIGAFAIFYATRPAGDTIAAISNSTTENNSPAETATAQNSPASVANERTDEIPIATSMASVSVEPKRAAANLKKRAQAKTAREEGGGSKTQALGTSKVITPPGIPDPSRNRGSNSSGAGDIAVRGVLEMLGMKADFVGGGWIVRSAAKNSIASRAGIQSNDVIEAVNDQSVGEKTMLKSGFQGKSISVRRDGKLVKLELKN